MALHQIEHPRAQRPRAETALNRRCHVAQDIDNPALKRCDTELMSFKGSTELSGCRPDITFEINSQYRYNVLIKNNYMPRSGFACSELSG
jgi:hypothetical protein